MTTSSHVEAPAWTAQPGQPDDTDVVHLFFIDHLLAAQSLGVDARTICGAWESPDDVQESSEADDVATIGGLIPLFEPEDCPRCAEGLAAFYAARLVRGDA